MNPFIVLQTALWRGGENAFCAFSYYSVIVTNVLALETNALKAPSKLPPHTVTLVATSDFQPELVTKLLLTGTHFRKRAVATLRYSPASTLHL